MHFVPDDRKADPLQNGIIQFFFVQVRKLDERATAYTARVMMTFFIVEMLEMMVLFSEGGLADNSRLQKFFEDAVDGRPRDLAALVPALFQKLFRREMPVGTHDLIKNNPPSARELQAAALKIVFIFFLFVDDHVFVAPHPIRSHVTEFIL